MICLAAIRPWIILGGVWLWLGAAAFAQDPIQPATDDAATTAEKLQTLTGQERTDLVARLSDAQARDLLLFYLGKTAEAASAPKSPDTVLANVEKSGEVIRRNIVATASSLGDIPAALGATYGQARRRVRLSGHPPDRRRPRRFHRHRLRRRTAICGRRRPHSRRSEGSRRVGRWRLAAFRHLGLSRRLGRHRGVRGRLCAGLSRRLARQRGAAAACRFGSVGDRGGAARAGHRGAPVFAGERRPPLDPARSRRRPVFP